MDPLTNREQAKLQAEIARQEKQEKLAGQQKSMRAQAVERQQRRQQEMLRYQQGKSDWLAQVKTAPTFYPTAQQFEDPIAYIRSIQAEGSQHGICKIVPPVLPSVPSGLVLDKPEGSKLTFSTREQVVEQLTWENFDTARFWDSGKTYTIKDYERFADDFQRRRFGLAGCLPAKLVEADYWRQVSSNDNPVVEYGNDVEGTAFCTPDQQDPLGSSSWNLQVLPHVKQSTLRLLRGDAPGVSSPMLYIGMLFATFAWHVEDHYLYSINYQHLGAAKTWYGVPGSDADKFEAVVRQHVYNQAVAAACTEGKSEAEVAAAVHAALLGKTTMFSPQLLLDAGVHVTRVVQAPGEYVITFPRAYHGGFSNGFCVGEAVNFSIADWFPFGLEAANRYRRLGRLPVLAHDELLCLEGLALHEQLQQDEQSWQDHSQADLHMVLMKCFVHLMREQHMQRVQLLSRGLTHVKHLPFSASMPCCRCKGMIYIAEVVSGDEWTVPLCLACASAQPPASQCPLKIRVQSNIAELEAVAQSFEELLRQPVPEGSAGSCKNHSLDLKGLTETANFGLPEGSLDTGSPQDAFDWSAAPLPDLHPSASDATNDQKGSETTPENQPDLGQDLAAYQQTPEELVTCQRDAPEPLAKPTPAKSGKARGVRGPVHGVKGPTHRSTPSKGTSVKASSSSGQRGQSNSNGDVLPSDGQPSESEHAHSHRNGYSHDYDNNPSADPPPRAATPSYPPGLLPTASNPQLSLRLNKSSAAQQKEQPVVARRFSQRTPRKRALSSDDEDDEAAAEQQRGPVWPCSHRHGQDRQGSRMASNSAGGHHEALYQAVHEDAEAARGYAERPRGPGKRPTVKWSKLGADAESPPGKRTKVQVPGVKAANGAYIPPGPMLNTAATRLACLEDVEVNVSAAGAPRRTFRRRIFAPEEDREERYLTASDVVKGSGFETNTSASNIIDRWTREACSIIVRHNQRNNTDLPMPELPARAFCAGMASSCYVLKAVDVEMLMLPGVLKDDLRANLQRYIANVWPRLALPLPDPLPAAQHPRGTHPAPRPLSRPSSAQPLAQPPTHHSRRKRTAPRGYDDPDPCQDQQDLDDSYHPHSRPVSAGPSWPRQARTARSGPGAGGAAKGPGDLPAGHGKGFGGIPATSNEDSPVSPRQQRNLRSRGGGSRAVKSAEQAAALRVVNWGSDQLQGSTSQGLDVLAGLAESALTEQQKAEESPEPPAYKLRNSRPQSAAAALRSSARAQPSFEPTHAYQRQPFSQPEQPHVHSMASQAMPSGPFHPTAVGQSSSATFRQPSLASEPSHSAPLQPPRQLQQQSASHHGHIQSRPFSAGVPLGQGPLSHPQDPPAAVLWRGGGSDTIIRPQAVRSTGFPIPGYAQPQQVSVAALHSKPLGALSPGSPTSVIQRPVQGPQGTAQHPLDPSPPSADSAPVLPQQKGPVSSAISAAAAVGSKQSTESQPKPGTDGVSQATTGAAASGDRRVKSDGAGVLKSEPQQSHPMSPFRATAQGVQWPDLANYAALLRGSAAKASGDQPGQPTPAPLAATAAVSAPADAQKDANRAANPPPSQPSLAPPAASPVSTMPVAQHERKTESTDTDDPLQQQRHQQQQQQPLQQHEGSAEPGRDTAGQQLGQDLSSRPLHASSQRPPAQAQQPQAPAVTDSRLLGDATHALLQHSPAPVTGDARQHSNPPTTVLDRFHAPVTGDARQHSSAPTTMLHHSSAPVTGGARQHGNALTTMLHQSQAPVTGGTRQHSQSANAAAVSSGLPSAAAGNSSFVSSRSDQPSQHQHAAAPMPQQAPSWSVVRLQNGQWVCSMQDGAMLTLGQLLYTLHSVGKSLPQNKLQALGMMIEQLTRLGEKCPPLPQTAA